MKTYLDIHEKEATIAVHKEAHGFLAEEVIEVTQGKQRAIGPR